MPGARRRLRVFPRTGGGDDVLRADFEPELAALPVTLRDARIDAAIDAGGLDGSLGGGLSYADLLELVFAMDPSTSVEDYEWLYDVFADLEPSPSDPLSCDALSVGIRLGAVNVTTAEP